MGRPPWRWEAPVAAPGVRSGCAGPKAQPPSCARPWGPHRRRPPCALDGNQRADPGSRAAAGQGWLAASLSCCFIPSPLVCHMAATPRGSAAFHHFGFHFDEQVCFLLCGRCGLLPCDIATTPATIRGTPGLLSAATPPMQSLRHLPRRAARGRTRSIMHVST